MPQRLPFSGRVSAPSFTGIPVVFVFVALVLATPASAQTPVGAAFTYQGRLTDAGSPANGSYDFEFKLFTALSGGTQVGSTITATGVPVSAGLFIRQLDFGAGTFLGTARFLEIGVKLPAAGSYTLLGARQELTPAPNAVFAAKAGDATTVGGLTCTTGQVAKWSGSAWTCGSDVDTNSGGTVTSVATGAGLTGGPITGGGTVSIAKGGVIAEMIAPGQVTKSVNHVTDDITIVGSGLASVSTEKNTITIAVQAPGLPRGAFVLGEAGDTTLIGAGYTEVGSSGLDVWRSTTPIGAPTGRTRHTAVWTGTRMIVWGGSDATGASNTGGQYDPIGDSWAATATTAGVPTGRYSHTAVWTGTRMIVWGGSDATGASDTGGQYDPIGDSWAATATEGVPKGRYSHTAVWTGTRMIVWGGTDRGAYLDTGGLFNPAGNSWKATATTVGVPTARALHTAVWTGSRMIVWGGANGASVRSGGQYDPQGDSWTATALGPETPTSRYSHTAVWTGSRMIVWGGGSGVGSYFDTGGLYDPAGNSWTTTATTAGVPKGRWLHTAAWTGSRMIVWGGADFFGLVPTGGQYDPAANSWTATAATPEAPTARTYPTSVWTGSRMIVWGGFDGTYLNTGGQWFSFSYYMKN